MAWDIEAIATDIVDAAVKVHRELGPGLLEPAYQQCLAFELRSRRHIINCEVKLPIRYAGQEIDAAYRIDMIVDKMVIVENKTVDQILPIHEAQLLTYLKLYGAQIGFILNWNNRLMRSGICRMVNQYRDGSGFS